MSSPETLNPLYKNLITPFSLKNGTVKKVVIAPLESNPF